MTTVSKNVSTVSVSVSQRIAAGLALVFVAGTLLYTVGLSQIAVAHNTAHDTRHAIGFPCH